MDLTPVANLDRIFSAVKFKIYGHSDGYIMALL
jgi:hypothetical protein